MPTKDDAFEMEQLAAKYGWTVLYSSRNGYNFQRGYTHIWFCYNGWQCADLIDNHFYNHRLKPGQTLEELLIQESK